MYDDYEVLEMVGPCMGSPMYNAAAVEQLDFWRELNANLAAWRGKEDRRHQAMRWGICHALAALAEVDVPLAWEVWRVRVGGWSRRPLREGA